MSETNSKVRSYDPKTSAVFLKTTEKFGGLSNMAAGYPLEVNGIAIRTSEALYQAMRFPHMPDLQRTIIDEASPMTAKMRTKPHRENSREDWDRVRVKIMRWCLQVKLAQNIDKFGALLLSTADSPIVEFSKKDQFWGAEPTEDGRLVGMNVLGRLLMELREQLLTNGAGWFSRVEPLPIDHFELLRRHIEPVVSRRSAPADASPSRVVPRDLFSAPTSEAPRQVVREAAPSLADLRPYAGTRNTGVDWLPTLPTHWELHRAKFSFREVDERSLNGEEELLSVSHKTGVTPRSQKNVTMFKAESYSGHKVCRPGDIAVNTMWAWMAAIGVSRDTGIVSPSYGVYRPRPTAQFYGRYLDYLLRTEAYRAEFTRSSRGITTSRLRLYPPDFLNIPFVQPPLEEQRLIVRFLDWHGSVTARLLRAKRQLIDLLSEQKEVVIRRATTRGLDLNATMVPSGVEWLGDLPSHWSVSALRHRYEQCLGKMLDEKKITGRHLMPYLRNTDVQWDRINTEALPSMDISTSEYDRYTVRRGDLLVCEGGEVGRAAIWRGPDSEVGFQKALHRLRAINPANDVPRFMYYQLWTGVHSGAFQDGHESTIAHLTGEKLRRHRFAFPPRVEQEAIVAHLDATCEQLDHAAKVQRREISLALELRTTLISRVVMGNLDVRALAESLPEESPQILGDMATEELTVDGVDLDGEMDVEDAA